MNLISDRANFAVSGPSSFSGEYLYGVLKVTNTTHAYLLLSPKISTVGIE